MNRAARRENARRQQRIAKRRRKWGKLPVNVEKDGKLVTEFILDFPDGLSDNQKSRWQSGDRVRGRGVSR